MTAARVTVEEAKPFFADKSQHFAGITPDRLPAGPEFQYWVSGPVCGIFHLAPWPDVWMGHYGVKPEGWGRTVGHGREILSAFWATEKPERIVGWTPESNRAALAFARRLGFEIDGEMDLPSGKIIMQGWTPWVLEQQSAA